MTMHNVVSGSSSFFELGRDHENNVEECGANSSVNFFLLKMENGFIKITYWCILSANNVKIATQGRK